MKKHFTISLIVVVLSTLLALILGRGRDILSFMLLSGTICCVLGVFSMIVGFIFMGSKKNRKTGEAFLISAGITFLLGTGACGVGLGSIRAH